MHKLKEVKWLRSQEGKMGYAIAWLIGVPLPILLLVYLLRGCS